MTAPAIAVLDTDPAFLSLMHDLLSEEGYIPLLCHASEWIHVHAQLRRQQPHLVILDLWMAERGDGWAFLKRLWDDTDTTHIPALILTGEPDLLPVHADVLPALHCRVVKKPFHLQDLLDAIAALLGPSPAQHNAGPQLQLHALPAADRALPELPDYPFAAAAEGAS